jgi:hypothetical protein
MTNTSLPREARADGSVLRAIRHDEERHAELVLATPRLCRLMGVATTDDSADPPDSLIEELLVNARRRAVRRLLVGPGPPNTQ